MARNENKDIGGEREEGREPRVQPEYPIFSGVENVGRRDGKSGASFVRPCRTIWDLPIWPYIFPTVVQTEDNLQLQLN